MNNVVIFGGGVIIGALIALFSVRKYVKQKLNDETERIHKDAEDDIMAATKAQKEKLQAEYEEALKQYRSDDKPYRITADEFDSADFDTESLTMYKNNVFIYDANDEKIENVDEIIGVKNIPNLSEGVEAFYIRNPKKQMDYEINIMLCEWTGEDELIE